MKNLIRSKAPLRLGLAGGGSDVSPYSDEYGGCVLNATISLYSYCTIEEVDGETIELISPDTCNSLKIDTELSQFELNGKLDLIKHVLKYFLKENFIDNYPGCKITTYCDAPPGSGLGSSSHGSLSHPH